MATRNNRNRRKPKMDWEKARQQRALKKPRLITPSRPGRGSRSVQKRLCRWCRAPTPEPVSVENGVGLFVCSVCHGETRRDVTVRSIGEDERFDHTS
jgi:hypothetical protein